MAVKRLAGRYHSIGIIGLLAVLCCSGSALWAQGNAAEKDFAFAQGLYGQENYQLAADKFVAFIKQYPSHANMSIALFRAGECLFRVGRHAEAEPYFQRLTTQFADTAEAEPGWLWLGDTNFQAGHYDEAVTAYTRFIQKYPKNDQNGRASYWLGESLYHLNQFPQAITAYQQALGKQLSDQDAAYTRYGLGWSYLQINEPEKSADCFQQVVEKYPASAVAAESMYLLATAQRKARSYSAALASYQKVIAKYPEAKFAALAQSGIGWCYFEQKDYAQARDAFQKVTTQYPQAEPAAEARLRTADCLFHLKRYGEAAATYEAVAQDAKSQWADEALYWAAVSYELAPDRDRAVAANVRLTRDFPQSPRRGDSYLHLGRLQLAAGQAEAATASYQSAIGAAKTPALKQQATAELAWAGFQRTKSEQALADLEQAIRQDPKPGWAVELIYQVALAHFTAGRFAPALSMLDLLAASHPEAAGQPEVLYLTAACQEKTDNPVKAEELYRKLLAEGQDNEYTGLAAASLVNLYARKGNLEQARKLTDDLQKTKASPEAKASALNALGEALYQAKKYSEALAAYGKSLTLSPDGGAAPYAQLGVAWAKLGAGDATAGESFLNLARKYPQSEAAKRAPEGLLAVAEKLFADGKFAEAQAVYKSLLDAFSQSDLADEAQYKLAWSLLKQDKPDEAQAQFTQVIPKASAPAVAADARYQAARLLAAKGEDKAAAALLVPFVSEYQETEVAPSALALLGRTEVDLKQYDEALRTLQLAQTRYPNHAVIADTWLSLARLYRQQKNPARALEALGKCLSTAQGATAAEAQFELAAGLRDQGDRQKAAEEFLKVTILYNDPVWAARAQYEAGQTYEQLQDKASAIKAYKLIIRDYPKQQQWVDQAAARLKVLEP